MNPAVHLTAVEFDQLLACLRQAVLGPTPGKAPPRRGDAPDGLDWNRLVQAAQWHEVASALGQPLPGVLPEETPAWAREALNAAHADNARRVRLLGAELVALVVRLRVSGVAALPLKGPLLAAQFYPEVWSRDCGNLDLLIPPGSLHGASEALAREGYRFAPLTDTMGEDAQWHVEHSARFGHPQTGQKVSLHAQIVPRRYGYRLDFERLWQRARMQSLPAGRVASLSPEDWLIILSLHAIKNGFWPRLKLACDLARVLANPAGLDWGYVREESQRLGCERVVLLGLALANDLLGAELPAEWSEAIAADAVVGKIAARVRGRLARGETGFTTLWEATRTHAALRRHPAEKLRYALAVMTTPSERDFRFLGHPVSVPGSYAVRGVKLAGKCVGQALGRFIPTHHRAGSAFTVGGGR